MSRNIKRIDRFLELVDNENLLTNIWKLPLKDDSLRAVLSLIAVKDKEITEFWKDNPDLRYSQVLIGMGIIPNYPGFWFSYEDEDNLQDQGVDPAIFLIWGVNFDKDALINSYKDYLKTTAQNNVIGFEQADQYKDIDEHLNKRIGDLQGSTTINENPNFTTAPTKVNGITGFNKFLDSSDKSKSQQFENEAFYNFLDKSVELNKQTPTTSTPALDNYHRFNSITSSIINNDYAGKQEGFNTG